MSFKPEDFSKICRMCLLIKNEMVTLHASGVVKMIHFCVDIEVRLDDGLPQLICMQCFGQITNYSAFRQLCKHSDETLHKIIKNHNNSNASVTVPNIKTEFEDNIKNEPAGDLIITSECDLSTKQELDISDTDESSQEQDLNDKDNTFCVENEIKYCVICNKNIRLIEYETHLYRHNLDNKYECVERPSSFQTTCELTKTFECELCSDKFYSEYELNLHLKSHFPVCDICGREFLEKRYLIRHKQNVHEKGEKIFFCTDCDRSFSSDRYLQSHIKRCHDTKSRAERKKACPDCGKVVFNMRVHKMSAHSNEKPFKCNQCTKEFAINQLLSRHIQKRHSNADINKEPKALCPICGKVFYYRAELERHMVSHNENRKFDCHLCDRTYKSRSGLHSHLTVHKGVRAYSCTTCPQKFFDKKRLERHILTHTGERPYACHICGRAFNQASARKTHMKVHNILD